MNDIDEMYAQFLLSENQRESFQKFSNAFTDREELPSHIISTIVIDKSDNNSQSEGKNHA